MPPARSYSFTKDAAGKRQLDPAELDRVFGIQVTPGIFRDGGDPKGGADHERNAPYAMRGNEPQPSETPRRNETQPSESERIIAAQQVTIEQQAESIRHLRDLLEGEVAERRRMMALLTGPRAPWWRRWFR